MFYFCNTFHDLFNILSLFLSAIIISSTFLGFSSGFTTVSLFDLVTASAILFPKYTPALWTTFLKVVFTASSHVSNNSF